jgi:hypothetical protein
MTAMSSAFVAAVDAIFRDATMAEDARWKAGGAGNGIAVRVIRKSPDEVVPFGDSRAILPSVLIDVRKTEIPSPAVGDVVEIGADTFSVIAEPRIDGLGMIWTCEGARRE